MEVGRLYWGTAAVSCLMTPNGASKAKSCSLSWWTRPPLATVAAVQRRVSYASAVRVGQINPW